jgi:hypothetical protein
MLRHQYLKGREPANVVLSVSVMIADAPVLSVVPM